METKAVMETLITHTVCDWTWNINLNLNARIFKAEGVGSWKELSSEIFEVGAGTPQHSRWKFSVTKRDDCMQYFEPPPDDGLALGIHFLEFVQSGNGASGKGQKFECLVKIAVSGLNSATNKQGNVCDIKKYRDFSVSEPDLYEELIPWATFCSQHKNLFADNVMQIRCKLTFIGDTATKTAVDFGPSSQEETQTMAHYCGKFYNNTQFSDFTIVLIRDSGNPTQFFAHKFILAAQSPVFRRMLQTPTKEIRENKLEIKDMNLKTLTLMLQFIYNRAIEIPEDKLGIFGLLNAAKLYELNGLSKLVLLKLQSLLNDENVGDWTVAAHECARRHVEVISVLRSYCQRRHNILWKNPKYKELYQQNPAAFIGE